MKTLMESAIKYRNKEFKAHLTESQQNNFVEMESFFRRMITSVCFAFLFSHLRFVLLFSQRAVIQSYGSILGISETLPISFSYSTTSSASSSSTFSLPEASLVCTSSSSQPSSSSSKSTTQTLSLLPPLTEVQSATTLAQSASSESKLPIEVQLLSENGMTMERYSALEEYLEFVAAFPEWPTYTKILNAVTLWANSQMQVC
jgi:hypothetical protein